MATVTIAVPPVKSWKTTLMGILMSAAIYLATLEGIEGTIGKGLVIALPIVWGFVQKDANVTGGTVVQPSTIEAKEAITTAPTTTP